MVDAFTRRIVAFYLTFDSPSYNSCMMVFRECVQRHERLPQIIIVDNGKEFDSTAFETLIASYNKTKKSRPPAKSRFGSVCERLFGTTNTEFIYGLAGNTQISKKVRIMTKSVNPKNLALWNLYDLTNRLNIFFYEIYDVAVHPALHDTPKNTHEKGIEVYGERRHMIIPYTEDFIIRTLPSTPNGTAKVNFTTGIQIKYIRYWHDSFRDMDVECSNVPVKYDPFDAGIAYAYVKGRWVQCISEYYSVFKGRSRKEVSFATQELRKKNQSTRKLKEISARTIAIFLEDAEIDEAVLEKRKNEVSKKTKVEKPNLEIVGSLGLIKDIPVCDQKKILEDDGKITIMEEF